MRILQTKISSVNQPKIHFTVKITFLFPFSSNESIKVQEMSRKQTRRLSEHSFYTWSSSVRIKQAQTKIKTFFFHVWLTELFFFTVYIIFVSVQPKLINKGAEDLIKRNNRKEYSVLTFCIRGWEHRCALWGFFFFLFFFQHKVVLCARGRRQGDSSAACCVWSIQR